MSTEDALRFRTEVSSSLGDRPDLVGFGSDGSERLIVEAKFWAGLTDNQPVAYLRRLPDAGGALIFLAPEERLSSLWFELVNACIAEGIEVSSLESTSSHRTGLADGRPLVVTSWRSVLETMLGSLGTGDHGTRYDVEQLQALCDRMDREAFIPLTQEDLAPGIARRLIDLRGVVDDVGRRLARDGWLEVSGKQSNADWYGFYVGPRDSGDQLWFGLWLHHWATTAPTPLWMEMRTPHLALFRPAFRELELAQPPRAIEQDDILLFPLSLPLAVDREKVVAALLDQVVEIAARRKSALEATSGPAP